MKTKLQIPDIIFIIALASTLLYVVFFNLPEGIRSFRYFWAPMVLGTMFLTHPKLFIKNPMPYLLLYGIFFVFILPYTLWNIRVDFVQGGVLDEFYSLVVFTAIWCYYRVKGDFKPLAQVSKWAFVFIVITMLLTNVALTIDPLIVRNSAAGFFGNPDQIRLNKLTGSAQYGYAQAFVLLIPILVYHIKSRKRMVFPRTVLIAILILLLITSVRAQVFANLLVTTIITFLAFIGYGKRHLVFRYMVIFLIVFVIIPISFYANILKTLSTHFEPSTELYYKLNDFATFIETPELDTKSIAGSRAERYPLLFEALLANPLAGHISSKSSLNIDEGGHLYWMYKLVLYGIPFFFFFVFVLYKIYKSISSVFDDPEIRFYYFLSVLAFILFGLLKNMAGREPWLFIIVVIPGLYFLPLHQQQEK